ncbi:hypothetical protein D3C78_17520 [compost metagenome]
MRIDREFVPVCPILRSYMPCIKITIADQVLIGDKVLLYLAVKHPYTSTSLTLKATTKTKDGMYDVKIISENREIQTRKILDALFGVAPEECHAVLTSLLTELLEQVSEFDGYDVGKTMQELLPWSMKRETLPVA